MSGDVSEDLEKEILPFLSLSARPDLKAIAVQYVAGITASASGCQMLCKGESYVDALVKLTNDDDTKIQKQTYDALINLTSYQESAAKVIGSSEVKDTCMAAWIKHILDKKYLLADSVSQLLTNLTRSEVGAEMLWSELKRADVSIERMVDVLCAVNYNEKANNDHLASMLSNLTQLPQVRRELLDAKGRSLQRLLAFVGHQGSEVRRRGAVSAIRNCCMEAGSHEWLLGEDVDVLPRLLLPLAGGEEFEEEDMERLPEDLQYLPPSKLREPCCDIRVMLVEALIQLCNTKPGRQYVKAKNTYVIMRELYNWETDDRAKETIHDLIDILIGDEPSEEHATLKEVQIPADIAHKFSQEDTERTNSS